MPTEVGKDSRLSVLRIVDDTLEEFGLPGIRDIIPMPQHLLSETLGVPSPNDVLESLQEKILGDVRTRRPNLPRLPGY